MGVKDRAAEVLGCKADIMTRDSLHNMLREPTEAAAVRGFRSRWHAGSR